MTKIVGFALLALGFLALAHGYNPLVLGQYGSIMSIIIGLALVVIPTNRIKTH